MTTQYNILMGKRRLIPLKKIFIAISLIVLTGTSNGEERQLRIGLIKEPFTLEEIGGENFNEIVSKIFIEDKKYQLEFVEGDWGEINRKFSQGDVDIIFPVEKKNNAKEDIIFSQNIYSQSFYITSNEEEIRDLKQLIGKNIYVLKDSAYLEYLQGILKNNDIQAEVIQVEDLDPYRDFLLAQPSSHIQNMRYKKQIGILPFTAIAYRGEDRALMDRVNDYLNSGYRERIIAHKDSVEKKFRKDFFLNSLTNEELITLLKLRKLNVGYEENSIVSHYVAEKSEYRGLIPLILEEIAEDLDMKINIVSDPYEQWGSLVKKLDNGKIDFLSMVRTEPRENSYIFSKKIYDIKVYRIYNPTDPLEGKKIGVIGDSIEDYLAKKYFPSKDIVRYESAEELVKGLRKHEISSALNFDEKLIGDSGYVAEKFYSVPMNFAFLKDREILRNIIQKAYDYLVDKDDLEEKFEKSERALLEEKLKKATYSSFYYKIGGVGPALAALFIIFFTLSSYKIKRAKKIAQLAYIDSLTLLKNRFSFDNFSVKNGKTVGVALAVDIDNFKRVNDSMGRQIGDKVIKHCAYILKKVFPQESVFRVSGDEYYVFIKKESYEEKLEELKNSLIHSKTLSDYGLTCSIGYCIKDSNQSMDEAFKFADMAMYKAKTVKGVSCFKATDELIEEVKKLSYIRENMEKVIQSEFYPVFQPKYSVKDPEKLVGAETLARWTSPVLGVVYPSEFIYIGEDLRIIDKLDLKMAEESIKRVKRWLIEGYVEKDFKISFNVSMYTFENQNVPQEIEKLLKIYDLPGENIEVEITESIISRDLKGTLKKLAELKELGVGLSLDDFTAGHSTAGILPILPIDTVKLDRSLIISVGQDSEKGGLVYKALIKLIKNMNLTLVAEGIELQEEFKFLQENEVDIVQGYLFGKPMIEEEFIKKNQ